MIILFVALYFEAKSIIENLNLKRDNRVVPFDTYSNEKYILVICGIGQMNCCMAVSSVLTLRKKVLEQNENILCLNIGIAGSLNNTVNTGNIFVAKKVVEIVTGKAFYPDMLFNFSMEECNLYTAPMPITRKNINDFKFEYDSHVENSVELVDMEGYSFFYSCSKFIELQNIHCLKIVSDNLDFESVSPEFVTNLVSDNISEIQNTINTLENFSLSKKNILDNRAIENIEIIAIQLNLTQTQRHQLKEYFTYSFLKNGFIKDIGSQFIITPKNKEERKIVFEQLKNHLLS